jgi:DNA-binding MarR family transcriptional regulator
MAKPKAGAGELAAQAWALLFDALMASTATRAKSLAARGLTPNDARALWSLSTDERRPIGSLAKDWECDPSNATFIVGRLERAGLADRREDPGDRRVKLIGLTSRGARIKQQLMAEYRIPPPEILQLSASDLRALIEILSRIRKRGS